MKCFVKLSTACCRWIGCKCCCQETASDVCWQIHLVLGWEVLSLWICNFHLNQLELKVRELALIWWFFWCCLILSNVLAHAVIVCLPCLQGTNIESVSCWFRCEMKLMLNVWKVNLLKELNCHNFLAPFHCGHILAEAEGASTPSIHSTSPAGRDRAGWSQWMEFHASAHVAVAFQD